MSRHKTAELIERGAEILRSHHPMTVRQVYYQLISGHVLENSRSNYKAVVNAQRDARREGLIPWSLSRTAFAVPAPPRCGPGSPNPLARLREAIGGASGRPSR